MLPLFPWASRYVCFIQSHRAQRLLFEGLFPQCLRVGWPLTMPLAAQVFVCAIARSLLFWRCVYPSLDHLSSAPATLRLSVFSLAPFALLHWILFSRSHLFFLHVFPIFIGHIFLDLCVWTCLCMCSWFVDSFSRYSMLEVILYMSNAMLCIWIYFSLEWEH